jgi:hypothetical protein
VIAFPVPTTSAEFVPSFTDAEGCRQWLAGLPLANAVQSQALLLRQLKILNRYGLGGDERLRMLEILRPALLSAQESCVRRYAWKPLPLPPGEQAAFESTQSLWQALADGYLQCLAGALEEGAAKPGNRDQVALLAQRALAAICSAHVDAYPGGRNLGASSWRLMYQVFSACEERSAATLKVDDRPRHGNSASSPAEMLAEAALLHVGAPNELTPRQFGWLVRWARHWARRVNIVTQPPRESKALPLYLDLASDLPPAAGSGAGAGAGTRWLDVGELRSSIKTRLAKLAAGAKPAELGLGEDCVSPAGDKLLKHVYRCWCKGGGGRSAEVRAASGACSVVVGFAAIHEQVGGKPFAQPQHEGEISRRQSDEIATFGRIATHYRDEIAPPGVLSVEDWSIVEEWHSPELGSSGLRINRPLSSATSRISNGQLVTIKPASAQNFLLAVLRWVRVDAAESLQAGVEILPGLPEAVAVRGSGLAGSTDKFRPAFLLPAVAVLKQPARIVLPVNVFRANIVLEVLTAASVRIRLKEVIERGNDYDCVTYQPVP